MGYPTLDKCTCGHVRIEHLMTPPRRCPVKQCKCEAFELGEKNVG